MVVLRPNGKTQERNPRLGDYTNTLAYCTLTILSFLSSGDIFTKHPTLGDSASRHMPKYRHGCLKCVNISKFSAEKSLVELTRYILMYVVSLECLTLDTIHRRHLETSDRCAPIADWLLTEAHRALWAIKTYIIEDKKVPASVKLTVLKPCSQCHGGVHCKLCNV